MIVYFYFEVEDNGINIGKRISRKYLTISPIQDKGQV